MVQEGCCQREQPCSTAVRAGGEQAEEGYGPRCEYGGWCGNDDAVAAGASFRCAALIDHTHHRFEGRSVQGASSVAATCACDMCGVIRSPQEVGRKGGERFVGDVLSSRVLDGVCSRCTRLIRCVSKIWKSFEKFRLQMFVSSQKETHPWDCASALPVLKTLLSCCAPRPQQLT